MIGKIIKIGVNWRIVHHTDSTKSSGTGQDLMFSTTTQIMRKLWWWGCMKNWCCCTILGINTWMYITIEVMNHCLLLLLFHRGGDKYVIGMWNHKSRFSCQSCSCTTSDTNGDICSLVCIDKEFSILFTFFWRCRYITIPSIQLRCLK